MSAATARRAAWRPPSGPGRSPEGQRLQAAGCGRNRRVGPDHTPGAYLGVQRARADRRCASVSDEGGNHKNVSSCAPGACHDGDFAGPYVMATEEIRED